MPTRPKQGHQEIILIPPRPNDDNWNHLFGPNGNFVKKYRKVAICTTIGEPMNPDYRKFWVSILKNMAREMAKTNKEAAKRILEYIESEFGSDEPTEDATQLTKEIKKSNAEIYKQMVREMKKNNIKGVTRVKFLLNSNKKEIHNLKKISPLCNLDLLKNKHRLYLRNKKSALRAMAQGYDGCKHCMAKYHTQ